jgi:hypothetical protein
MIRARPRSSRSRSRSSICPNSGRAHSTNISVTRAGAGSEPLQISITRAGAGFEPLSWRHEAVRVGCGARLVHEGEISSGVGLHCMLDGALCREAVQDVLLYAHAKEHGLLLHVGHPPV